MPEAREIAEFSDEREGGDARHAAQGLPGVHDRGSSPRRRELTQVRGEPVDAARRFIDRVPILLERDVRRGIRETEIREPPSVPERPPFPRTPHRGR